MISLRSEEAEMAQSTIIAVEVEARFPFQSLDVYIAARELAALVHGARGGDCELRDQATRAAKSVFLNLCEGLPSDSGPMRRKHFALANGSLHELVGALDLASAIGALAPEPARRGPGLGGAGGAGDAHPACAPHRTSGLSIATRREASRATSAALALLASPQSAAISTAAAASVASARATVKARALSPRVTRPAPSAQLRQALLAERSASSRSFASRTEARRTASKSSTATP